MKNLILLICFIWVSVNLNAQQRTKAYISYLSVDSISSIDVLSHSFSSPIPFDKYATREIITTPENNTLLIVDYKNQQMLLCNTITDDIIISATLPHPNGKLSYTKTGKYLYCTYRYQIIKIDPATLEVLEDFVYRDPAKKQNIAPINFINDSIFIYTAGSVIYKYNLNKRQDVDSIEVSGKNLQFFNGKIYFVNENSLSIMDPEKMEITNTIETTNSKLADYVLYNNHLYFNANDINDFFNYSIEIFDLTTNSFLPPVELEYSSKPYLSPHGDLWMLDKQNKKVVIYSIAQNKITDEIILGYFPWSVAFAEGENHKSSVNAVNDVTTLKIYPNPTTDIITLETNYNKVKNYSVINSLGKTVMNFESEGEKTEVDISSLPQGVYFVISEGNKTKAIKFIKQ